MPIYTYNKIKPEIHTSVYIAPNAMIIGDVKLDAESSVWFGSVVRGDTDTIKIGKRTNIQDLSVCHADEGIPLTIGNNVTVGHRCIIHGCTIEDDCLIGMGAVIMNHSIVGKGSVIAAGSVVLENTTIPPYSLVAGSPGIIKRKIDQRPDIKASIKLAADIYAGHIKEYKDPLMFKKISD